MATHPSLSAKSALRDFEPQERMRPNAPCWCRSGEKWKYCHRDRESQAPINVYEQAEAMREEFATGHCSYTDAQGSQCDGQPIASHTIQRKGGLAAIQENHHVLSVRFSLEDLIKHNGQPPAKRVSTKKASTFPGFCASHDGKIFAPVETPDAQLDKEAAFLLAYRAMCFERANKLGALRSLRLMRDLDRGKPFGQQAAIQSMIDAAEQGTRLGVRDSTRWTKKYVGLMHGNDLSSFQYEVVVFDQALPLVVCGAWLIETDFHGNVLQKIGTSATSLEHVTFNLTTIGSTTAGIFGWTGAADGPASKFVESFKMVPANRKANVLASMAFEHSENVFMRESWWNGLSPVDQKKLADRITSGVRNLRAANALVDDGNAAISALAL